MRLGQSHCEKPATLVIGAALLVGAWPARASGVGLPQQPQAESPAVPPITEISTDHESDDARLSVELLSDGEGVQFGPYLRALLAEVRKSWPAFAPSQSATGPGSVSVVFEVLPNGRLKGGPKIESSSGSANVDKAAIFAIQYWKQFDSLPAEFKGSYLRLRLTFRYDVHGSEPADNPVWSIRVPDGSPDPKGPAMGYGVTILSNTQGVDFLPYVHRMLGLLKKNWEAIMPESARMGDKGVVSTVFSILPNGNIVSDGPLLERESGKEPLDRAALDAIRLSEPFDSLPAEFHGPYLKLRIAFLYNVKPEEAGLGPRKE